MISEYLLSLLLKCHVPRNSCFLRTLDDSCSPKLFASTPYCQLHRPNMTNQSIRLPLGDFLESDWVSTSEIDILVSLCCL